MACGPITSWQIEGENVEVVIDFFVLGSKSLWTVTVAIKSEDNCFLGESDGKPKECAEKQRHYSANKDPYSQGCGLPSGHVQLRELGRKEYRTPKI